MQAAAEEEQSWGLGVLVWLGWFGDLVEPAFGQSVPRRQAPPTQREQVVLPRIAG